AVDGGDSPETKRGTPVRVRVPRRQFRNPRRHVRRGARAREESVNDRTRLVAGGGWELRSAGEGRPESRNQATSNRSRFMTLSHADAKSRTNCSCPSSHA